MVPLQLQGVIPKPCPGLFGESRSRWRYQCAGTGRFVRGGPSNATTERDPRVTAETFPRCPSPSTEGQQGLARRDFLHHDHRLQKSLTIPLQHKRLVHIEVQDQGGFSSLIHFEATNRWPNHAPVGLRELLAQLVVAGAGRGRGLHRQPGHRPPLIYQLTCHRIVGATEPSPHVRGMLIASRRQ